MDQMFSLLLLVIVTGCYCACPTLKPNANVLVTCLNSSRRQFNCTTAENNNNESAIQVGTTVVYKCKKYFKPTSRRFQDGKINCTANGTWTNQKAFQSFHCEFDCGRLPLLQNELISQGNATKPKNWPWVATIFRQTQDGEFKYSCGGTLIGQRTVLTAAHCVTNEGGNKLANNIFRISLATVSSNYDQNMKAGSQIHVVKEIYIHPDYKASSLIADLALVVLAGETILTDYVLPICLPRSYEHDALLTSVGNNAEISSFGIDSTGKTAEILQHAYIPRVPNARCHDVIEVIPNSDQFCGGNPKGAKICRGDSGSGFVYKSEEWNDGKYSIHGIVSNTGEVENDCAPLVVFTKVISYISWIQEMILTIEKQGHTNVNTALFPVVGNRRGLTSSLYTKAERNALSKLRPLVNGILQETYMYQDEYLIRFLRAKKLNIQEAKENLQATMNWRKANRMNEILNEDFSYYRKKFPVLFQGYDKDGRPVFVYLFGHYDASKLVSCTDFEKLNRYLIRNYEEKQYKLLSIGATNITQSITITDFNGPNIAKNLCSKCLRIWPHVSRQAHSHYPQQIYQAYFINIPEIADIIIDALIPTIEEYKADRFRVFGTNKTEWSEELLKQIPADQLYTVYGGTKSIRPGTRITELAI